MMTLRVRGRMEDDDEDGEKFSCAAFSTKCTDACVIFHCFLFALSIRVTCWCDEHNFSIFYPPPHVLERLQPGQMKFPLTHSLAPTHQATPTTEAQLTTKLFYPQQPTPKLVKQREKKVCPKSEKTFSLHPCVRATMESLWRWHLTRTRLRLIILNMMFHTNGATLGSAIKFIWMLYRIACTIHITFRCLWT